MDTKAIGLERWPVVKYGVSHNSLRSFVSDVYVE